MATQAAFMPGTQAKPKALEVVWSWLTTVDHKRIGILYGVSAYVFFLVGGVEALLMRLQLAKPDGTVLSAQTFNELFTMHGTTMIFLAIMPMGAAFFNFIIPLQIGARDVAFPRLNALSYWVFLSGALFLHSSFLAGSIPDAGWFGYANLTTRQFSPGSHVDFWMLGLQILGLSSLMAGFNFIVTIINMRAPGMTLMRLPLFIWMSFVVQFLVVLAFPAITVALILLMFDRLFGTLFFAPAAGADPLLWQHLFWMFGHPAVYILSLPAMGIVSEVLPTFSRKPLFGAPVVIYSGIMIGFFGFGVWSHHMFSVGMGPVADSAFSIATLLIAVPTGVKIFNWIGTLWGGSIRFATPLLFSLGFISMFIMGGLSVVLHASPPVDLQQTDTYCLVAHFHYVLFGGSIFGLFSGVYYWFPKIFGKVLDERLGKLHFWLMLIGFNVTFFPMHFLGLIGMPRRIYTYAPDLGWNFWNAVATVGAFIIALSFVVFMVNVAKTTRSGAPAPADPWDARTLEWTISSPPPVYNFATIPTVHDRDDFWIAKYGDGHGTPPRKAAPAAHVDPKSIHMPPPSYWPLLLAAAIAFTISGLLISMYQVILGGLLTLYCMVRFMLEYHRPAAGGHH